MASLTLKLQNRSAEIQSVNSSINGDTHVEHKSFGRQKKCSKINNQSKRSDQPSSSRAAPRDKKASVEFSVESSYCQSYNQNSSSLADQSSVEQPPNSFQIGFEKTAASFNALLNETYQNFNRQSDSYSSAGLQTANWLLHDYYEHKLKLNRIENVELNTNLFRCHKNSKLQDSVESNGQKQYRPPTERLRASGTRGNREKMDVEKTTSIEPKECYVMEPIPNVFFLPVNILVPCSTDLVELSNQAHEEGLSTWHEMIKNKKTLFIRKHSLEEKTLYRVIRQQYDANLPECTEQILLTDRLFEHYCRSYQHLHFQQICGLFLYWCHIRNIFHLMSEQAWKVLLVAMFIHMGRGVTNAIKQYCQGPTANDVLGLQLYIRIDKSGHLYKNKRLLDVNNWVVQRSLKRIYPILFPIYVDDPDWRPQRDRRYCEAYDRRVDIKSIIDSNASSDGLTSHTNGQSSRLSGKQLVKTNQLGTIYEGALTDEVDGPTKGKKSKHKPANNFTEKQSNNSTFLISEHNYAQIESRTEVAEGITLIRLVNPICESNMSSLIMGSTTNNDQECECKVSNVLESDSKETNSLQKNKKNKKYRRKQDTQTNINKSLLVKQIANQISLPVEEQDSSYQSSNDVSRNSNEISHSSNKASISSGETIRKSIDSKSTPIPKIPLISTPSSQIPSNRTPSSQTPSNQIPSNQTPSKQTPSNQIPSNQTPSNQIPSQSYYPFPVTTDPIAPCAPYYNLLMLLFKQLGCIFCSEAMGNLYVIDLKDRIVIRKEQMTYQQEEEIQRRNASKRNVNNTLKSDHPSNNLHYPPNPPLPIIRTPDHMQLQIMHPVIPKKCITSDWIRLDNTKSKDNMGQVGSNQIVLNANIMANQLKNVINIIDNNSSQTAGYGSTQAGYGSTQANRNNYGNRMNNTNRNNTHTNNTNKPSKPLEPYEKIKLIFQKYS